MDTPEEFHSVAVKGRRNKRLRLICGGAGGGDATSSSSCGGGGEEFAAAAASSSVSGEVVDDHEISTEEEEDMANCLILLAQGDHDHHHRHRRRPSPGDIKIERISTKRFNFDHMGNPGFYVYECKTCNRTFPSFQALGGHRASHKKPKSVASAAVVEEQQEPQPNKVVAPVVQVPTRTTGATNFQAHKGGGGGKIHECSICGLEFTSGQALGGHMRRHRATGQQVVATSEIKQRNILELDLNLPAPEEDLRETKFQFTATPQTIVFSAPTLVDCHY